MLSVALQIEFVGLAPGHTGRSLNRRMHDSVLLCAKKSRKNHTSAGPTTSSIFSDIFFSFGLPLHSGRRRELPRATMTLSIA
jgi:hypothetical protein